MKLTDLLEVIAPDAKIDVMGIRPGEKLHEALVSTHEEQDDFQPTRQVSH